MASPFRSGRAGRVNSGDLRIKKRLGAAFKIAKRFFGVPTLTSAQNDNFNDNSLDTSKWINNYSVRILEQNQRLEIMTIVTAGNYALETKNNASLYGSSATVKVIDVGNQALTTYEFYPLSISNATYTNKVEWLVAGNVCYMFKRIGGVATNLGSSFAYSSSTHVYFRIREQDGFTIFDTSADGLAWTERNRIVNVMSLSDIKVLLQLGNYGTELSATTGIWDNYNGPSFPTVALNSPANASSGTDTTPTLNFTGTDVLGNTIEYDVQVDTVNTFDSIIGVAIIDSYSETNQGTFQYLGNTNITANGQAMTGNGGILGKVKFYLLKTGSPTGNAVAKIYAHSGTFGSTSLPTGSPLAVSDNLDVSTITGAYTLIDFIFSGANKITLTNAVNYIVTVEYGGNGGNPNDATNYLRIGADVTAPTHAGIVVRQTSSVWSTSAGADYCFYVYVAGTPILDKVSETDAGFTAGHPFASGVAIDFTVQAGDALPAGTYYWRVRAKDPSGPGYSLNAWSASRSFTITGAVSVNNTRAGQITGQDTANSARGAQVSGQLAVNDPRGAQISGQDTSNAIRPAQVTGSLNTNDVRASQTTGVATTQDTRGAQTTGQDTSNSSRGAQITGSLNVNDTRGAQVSGSTNTNDTRAATVHGSLNMNDARSAQTTGILAANDARSAQTTGQDTANNARAAQVTGSLNVNDARGARTDGVAGANAIRSAQTTGQDTSNASRGAQITGALSTQDTRTSQVTGIDTANSLRPAQVTGSDTSSSNRPAQVTGVLSTNDARGARTTGQDTAGANRGAQITGAANDASTRGAQVDGYLVSTAQATRGAQMTGTLASNATRGAMVWGKGKYPYTQKTAPYSEKTSPFTPRSTSPFSRKVSPYTKHGEVYTPYPED